MGRKRGVGPGDGWFETTWRECLERAEFHGLGHVLQALVLDGEAAITERKVQLLAVACARHVEQLLPDGFCRDTIDLAEQAADGPTIGTPLPTYPDIRAARDEYGPPPDFHPRPPLTALTEAAYELAAELADPEQVGARVRHVGSHAARLGELVSGGFGAAAEATFQIAIHRDIFGNLFEKVEFDPAWRTDTAVALARGMYESRDFGPMPVLADALQDAGCDDEPMRAHCRDPHAVHVRGCWVIDLVLGKA